MTTKGMKIGGSHRDKLPTTELSKRELQYVMFLSYGLTLKEMVRPMHIARGTINAHSRKVYDKLGANCAAHAVGEAYRRGLLA